MNRELFPCDKHARYETLCQEMNRGETLWSIKDLELSLQVHRRSIYRFMKRGELTGKKFGREWRFSTEEVDRFEKSRQASNGSVEEQ